MIQCNILKRQGLFLDGCRHSFPFIGAYANYNYTVVPYESEVSMQKPADVGVSGML